MRKLSFSYITGLFYNIDHSFWAEKPLENMLTKFQNIKINIFLIIQLMHTYIAYIYLWYKKTVGIR